MSTKGVRHYSESIDVRKRRTGTQRGPSTATVLDPVRDATPEEWRAAGVFAASTAIRQGWADGELADVVSMLGLDAA